MEEGRLVGRHWPALDPKWRREDLGEALASEGFTIVIWDSTREMLSQLGLGSNDEDALSALHALIATPLRQRGITPWLLDNTGHQET